MAARKGTRPNVSSRSDVVKAGHLTSKHSRSPSWRKRWYVLTDASLLGSRRKNLGYARLVYYSNEDEANSLAKPQGIIDLYACVDVQPRGLPLAGHSSVFDITTDDKRTHHFSAASPGEKQEWLDHLRRYIGQSNLEPLSCLLKSMKPRPLSEYSLTAVKPKRSQKSHSTKLSHSTTSAVATSVARGPNMQRRGSEDLDLELGSLMVKGHGNRDKPRLDYSDIDFSHMEAIKTVKPPISHDRVIYIQTKPLPKIPISDSGVEVEGSLDSPKADQKQWQTGRAPGFIEPAQDEATLNFQIKHCKIQEIPNRQISCTDGSDTRGVWREGSKAGHLSVLPVALKRGQSTVETLQEVVTLGQLRHPNIIRLHGVTVSPQPRLVMEVSHKGNLKHHLQSLRSRIEESAYENAQFQLARTLSLQLLQYCQNIALGLSYLASMGFVHNKLMAKAIVVSDKDICKISEFDGRHNPAPVKWSAPEASILFSTASDVWSFAIVMYEIWSLGCDPYQTFTDQEVVERVVKEGHRLPPTPGMAVELYNLMIHCWNPEPSSRPSCASILNLLSEAEPSITCSATVEGTMLGGPLKTAENIHKGLQQMYLKKPHQVKIPKGQDGALVSDRRAKSLKEGSFSSGTEQYEIIRHFDRSIKLKARLRAQESAQRVASSEKKAVRLTESCPALLVGCEDSAKEGDECSRYELLQSYERIQHTDIPPAVVDGEKCQGSPETESEKHYETVQTYERVLRSDVVVVHSQSHSMETGETDINGIKTIHYESIQTYEKIQHTDQSLKPLSPSQCKRPSKESGGDQVQNGSHICQTTSHYESVPSHKKIQHHKDPGPEMQQKTSSLSNEKGRSLIMSGGGQGEDGGSHYERIQHCDLSPQLLSSLQTVQDSEELKHCKQPLKQCDQTLQLSVH